MQPLFHLFKSGKMLDTPVGQLIVASCVVDDILALIQLSMFKVLVKENPPIYEYFIPIISSVGFLIVLGGSAVTWLPRVIENKILKKCSDSYRDLAMFTIMTVILLAYLPSSVRLSMSTTLSWSRHIS